MLARHITTGFHAEKSAGFRLYKLHNQNKYFQYSLQFLRQTLIDNESDWATTWLALGPGGDLI